MIIVLLIIVFISAGDSLQEIPEETGDATATEVVLSALKMVAKLEVKMEEMEAKTGEIDHLKAKIQEMEEVQSEMKSYKEECHVMTPDSIQLPYRGHPDRNGQLDIIVPFVNESAVQQLLKLLVQPSCYKWRQSGFSQSGYYKIDPDGTGIGQPPFLVFCDMVTGFTFVHHEDESEKPQSVDKCSGAGCYNRKIKYTAEPEQILSLIKTSESCQQHIKLECRQTPLLKNDRLLSWWVDQHETVQSYWSGDTDNHTCACGLSGSCANPRHVCNCNADLGNVIVVDEGYISNTNVLPVTELYFGDTIGNNKELKYQLGPLRCFGARSSAFPSSCWDVFKNGNTNNGYYIFGEEEDLKVQFCDIEKLTDRERKEGGANLPTAQIDLSSMLRDVTSTTSSISSISSQLTGVHTTLSSMATDMDLLRNPVIFNAVRTSDKNDENTYVVFDKVTVNVGGGYDATTGMFTAPVSGVYLFSANTRKKPSTNTRISLTKNGYCLTWAYSSSSVSDNTFGSTAVTNLTKGDEVGVYLDHGRIYVYGTGSTAEGDTIFVGVLLHK